MKPQKANELLLKGLRTMRPTSHELMNKSRGTVIDVKLGFVKQGSYSLKFL